MDRNFGVSRHDNLYKWSLSARRAWIEIVISAMTSQISVSLSARRAWIEMDVKAATGLFTAGRSPQGERG